MECVPIISFLFYLFRHLLILFSSFLSHLFLTSIFPPSLPSFVTLSLSLFFLFYLSLFLSLPLSVPSFFTLTFSLFLSHYLFLHISFFPTFCVSHLFPPLLTTSIELKKMENFYYNNSQLLK